MDCHTIFNFFSRRINTERHPDCPRCGRSELERKLSPFAISKGRKDDHHGDGLPAIDETRMERAFAALAGEMEAVDENNPKAMAQVMRKLYDATGLKLGPGVAEAIRRMERGEDPERIEAEMGDVLEEEVPFASPGKGGLKNVRRHFLPPKVDETLYEL